jgi:hypothetical protein
MAYMMKLNAVPPGNAALPTSADSLKKIRIAIPAPGNSSIRLLDSPNTRLVNYE